MDYAGTHHQSIGLSSLDCHKSNQNRLSAFHNFLKLLSFRCFRAHTSHIATRTFHLNYSCYCLFQLVGVGFDVSFIHSLFSCSRLATFRLRLIQDNTESRRIYFLYLAKYNLKVFTGDLHYTESDKISLAKSTSVYFKTY